MSSEFERMWDQVAHDLGWHDHNMRRDRPYNGQPHTHDGVRGATEIKGVTFRDMRDCFIRAVMLSTGGQPIGRVSARSHRRAAIPAHAPHLARRQAVKPISRSNGR